MHILLINPPHPSIGSRIPHEHLPPLGLLSVGGPLIDAGHKVRLLDAEFWGTPQDSEAKAIESYAKMQVVRYRLISEI